MRKVTSKWEIGDTVVSTLAASETWCVTEVNTDKTWARIECTTRENTISGIIQMLRLGGFVAYRK